MHNRRSTSLALAACALMLAGCQTPKHSNVLIFGTNTRGGIDVGYDPKLQTGGILVGYQRQEAVWMPLLANTNADGSAPVIPCGGTVADSLFVGHDGKGTDTYSVIASIGAKFNAKADNQTEAGGGLSQFFATGLAARTLALRGAELLTLPSDASAKARAEAEVKLEAGLRAELASAAVVRGKLLAYAGVTPDADLPKIVTPAKSLNIFPAGTPLDTPAQIRAALNKFLDAGQNDKEALGKLQSLATTLNL